MIKNFLAILVIALSSFTLHVENATGAPALLLYGDTDHNVFLGCLNCGQYDQSSVCNIYGNFGSEYQSDSIWNEYGQYASKYSATSPWNQYGTTPPVIVDEDGNFYGYMTANKYFPNRTGFGPINQLTELGSKMTDLKSLREIWCKN